jgi:hypothetical protein
MTDGGPFHTQLSHFPLITLWYVFSILPHYFWWSFGETAPIICVLSLLFFFNPSVPVFVLIFLKCIEIFFLLPPLYFFFFPHFILYANRHLHNPRFPIIFVYIAVVFFADSESRPKKERFCNAPAAAPPPPRWPPPRTSRPDVTTRRHDRQHWRHPHSVTPDVTREEAPGQQVAHLPESAQVGAASRSRLARTVGTTCRGKSFPVAVASRFKPSSADRSPLPNINRLYTCPSLSYAAALSLAVSPWDWHVQYKLLFHATSSHPCLRKEPHLTIGDLAFFGTWNLNKVRSDESEFRSLQVLC